MMFTRRFAYVGRRVATKYLAPRAVRTAVIALLLVPVLFCTGVAIEKPNGGFFGFKAGMVGTSEMDCGWRGYELDGGASVGLFADQRVGPRVSVGFYMDFDQITDSLDNHFQVGFGLMLKTGFPNEKKGLLIRPGLGVGYAYLEEFRRASRLHFFTVKGSIELDYFVTPGFGLLLDVGAVAAPVGGRDKFWTNDMRLMVRGGVIF